MLHWNASVSHPSFPDEGGPKVRMLLNEAFTNRSSRRESCNGEPYSRTRWQLGVESDDIGETEAR